MLFSTKHIIQRAVVSAFIMGLVFILTADVSAHANNVPASTENRNIASQNIHNHLRSNVPDVSRLDLAGLALVDPSASKDRNSSCLGLFISFSTEFGEFAADGQGNNSPYTEALADTLNTPELTLQKMSKQIRRKVQLTSSKQAGSTLNQNPMYVDATNCDYQLTNKSDSRPRYALVIGNGNYAKVSALKNPGNDAELVAPKLLRLSFEVKLLIDASYSLMKTAIAELNKKIEKSDNGAVVVVFYAGHGFQMDGKNYWAPVDMPAGKNGFDDVVNSVIPFNNMFDKETRSKSLVIIFNDTVRNNPFEINKSR